MKSQSKTTRLMRQKSIWLLLVMGFTANAAQAFTHPGLLNNAGDLNRAKAGISAGTEPWRSAWERIQNSQYPGVSGSYTASPIVTITDNGSFNDE